MKNPQVLNQKGLPRGVTQVGYLVGLPPRRANFDVRIPKPVVEHFRVNASRVKRVVSRALEVVGKSKSDLQSAMRTPSPSFIDV